MVAWSSGSSNSAVLQSITCLRIIYFYFESDQQIWLMALYGKDEASDLTAREKTALEAAMDLEVKTRVQKQAARRGAGRRR